MGRDNEVKRMEKYREYKDSKDIYVESVPSHWEELRIKQTGSARNGLTYSPIDVCENGEPGTLVLRSSNIQEGKLVFEDNVYVSCPIREELYVRKGDILICSRNGSRDLVGKLVMIDSDIVASFGAFMMVYRTKLWNKFMSYAVDVSIKRYKSLFSTSTINQLVKNDFGNFIVQIPPKEEQNVIVSYLDTKCSKIETLLSNKEKEISLLQEMKQRIIADAVTRGLNPNVKFKSTNIPWLPEIPEHWDVMRAKNLFQKEQRPVQEGDEIVTCFRDGEVTLRKNRRTSGFTEATDYSHYQHICKGDLVIHQMDAFAGSSGVSDSDGMGTPVLSVCTPKNDGIDNYYYAHILRLMGKNGFILSLYRGIRERSSDFRFDTFVKQWLPVPPLSEQHAIVSYIIERTAKIDSLIEKQANLCK